MGGKDDPAGCTCVTNDSPLPYHYVHISNKLQAPNLTSSSRCDQPGQNESYNPWNSAGVNFMIHSWIVRGEKK